jgi:hypothetical protein
LIGASIRTGPAPKHFSMLTLVPMDEESTPRFRQVRRGVDSA